MTLAALAKIKLENSGDKTSRNEVGTVLFWTWGDGFDPCQGQPGTLWENKNRRGTIAGQLWSIIPSNIQAWDYFFQLKKNYRLSLDHVILTSYALHQNPSKGWCIFNVYKSSFPVHSSMHYKKILSRSPKKSIVDKPNCQFSYLILLDFHSFWQIITPLLKTCQSLPVAFVITFQQGFQNSLFMLTSSVSFFCLSLTL